MTLKISQRFLENDLNNYDKQIMINYDKLKLNPNLDKYMKIL